MREDQALRPDMPELRNAAADRACVKITRGLIEEYINGLRRKQHPFDSRKTYRRALQLFCDSLPESMEQWEHAAPVAEGAFGEGLRGPHHQRERVSGKQFPQLAGPSGISADGPAGAGGKRTI